MMPKTTSMMSKCLVYIVYFVWNMMKHMPHKSTLHLQYLCFVFVLRQAHFNWVGQGRSRWSSLSECNSSWSMCWDAAKPVRRPGDSRRGPRVRNALSIMWQMARGSLVLFRASYMSLWQGLLIATIQAINTKMDHEHFFEWMAVLCLLTFWWIRWTPPIVLL